MCLWTQLDALYFAYVTPGMIPPGAFRPEPEHAAAADRATAPALAPGVRLHFDPRRDRWLLLAPERVIETDGPGPEILKRCDGARTLGAIIDELAAIFAAERQVIAGDVDALLASSQPSVC